MDRLQFCCGECDELNAKNPESSVSKNTRCPRSSQRVLCLSTIPTDYVVGWIVDLRKTINKETVSMPDWLDDDAADMIGAGPSRNRGVFAYAEGRDGSSGST
ncbi:hypothetical protein ACH5RR_037131 [Cinchona calisaya]|uniref:Uncharacterized protein n=1 Tax=Cinchona calisaya TaxID=153742 RepID=A0ABD2Y9Y7_9GENT